MTGIGFTIAFGLIAASLLLSALLAVSSKNLVHGVLWLGVTLASTAVLYLVLDAPFMAGIQLLLYVGGVMTLMIFGLMLTRQSGGTAVTRDQRSRGRGAIVASLLFGVIAAATLFTKGLDGLVAPPRATTPELGMALLTEHLLAFEVLSVLLLAAMIGAIVLSRRRDHIEPSPDADATTRKSGSGGTGSNSATEVRS